MKCKNCDKELSGRTDKKFCSVDCRSKYWYKKNSSRINENWKTIATVLGYSVSDIQDHIALEILKQIRNGKVEIRLSLKTKE